MNSDAPRLDDDAEIERLARLSPLAYEHERDRVAETIGCRVSILDRLVREERSKDTPDGSQGRRLDLPERKPWPDAVMVAIVLNNIASALGRHVVLEESARDAAALWVVAVHAFAGFSIFPRLFVTAPTKGAGKTTLLDTIERLVPRPLPVANATAAALFRTIPTMRPVLLLDEADAWVRNSEDVRAVIDAGHKRGGAVLRCVGDEAEPRSFDVFAPVVLAAIGHLPDTIEDRSIIIPLRRKSPNERVEPLRVGHIVLDRLARQAARVACDHANVLAAALPTVPSSIGNRAADNWTPLLAVADLAGGTWPERARRAAATLTGTEDQSIAIMLLADIRQVVGAEDRASTENLAARLCELEDRPWPEFRNGRPMTKTQIARMLSRFGILSQTIRLEGGVTLKGYYRAQFDDAFGRYLPPTPSFGNVTTPQPNNDGHFRDSTKRHNAQADGIRDVCESDQRPSNRGDCDAATDCASLVMEREADGSELAEADV